MSFPDDAASAGGDQGYEAEEASVAHAGEPQQADDSRALAEERGPNPEDLDAREANFAGPRKPMGPGASETSATDPDEG